jgi:hypothetical protein
METAVPVLRRPNPVEKNDCFGAEKSPDLRGILWARFTPETTRKGCQTGLNTSTWRRETATWRLVRGPEPCHFQLMTEPREACLGTFLLNNGALDTQGDR